MTTFGRLATLFAVSAIALFAYNRHESIDISNIEVIHELPEPIREVVFVEPEDFLVKVDIDEAEFNCMRTNLYFEARDRKTDEAFIAVGYTVLNRVEAKGYPNSVCAVIQQARRDVNGNVIRNQCHFSWFCDGKPDVPNLANALERRAWERAGIIAEKVLKREVDNPIGNAIMYHADYVNPYWKRAYKHVATIENHIFYTKA